MKFSSSLIFSLLALFIVQGCASSGLSVDEPHMYSYPYVETLKAVDEALKSANMTVLDSNEEADSYSLTVCFVDQLDNFNLGDNDPNLVKSMVHTANIIVKKKQETLTEILVIERRQVGVSASVVKQNLARDFYRKLDRVITANPPTEY